MEVCREERPWFHMNEVSTWVLIWIAKMIYIIYFLELQMRYCSETIRFSVGWPGIISNKCMGCLI